MQTRTLQRHCLLERANLWQGYPSTVDCFRSMLRWRSVGGGFVKKVINHYVVRQRQKRKLSIMGISSLLETIARRTEMGLNPSPADVDEDLESLIP